MSQYLNESSLEQLYSSAIKAFPNTTKRQHATHPVVIKEMDWTPFIGLKTLFIRGVAQNENSEYNSLILFKGVKYALEEQDEPVTITASDGRTYTFGKLSLENSDVLVRCSCPDFSWRFNFYNHLDRSLYGRKRKKHENQGGPPANPETLPGMCKHLMVLASTLVEAGALGW